MDAGVLGPPYRRPPYRRIAGQIRARIEVGELRPGDRVPSARAITREWGVAIATATKALALLREEGLTVPRPGVGTVVAHPEPPDAEATGTQTTGTGAARTGAARARVAAGRATAGQMAAGRVPAGRVAAGRVPAGRVAAGRVPASRVAAGRVTRPERELTRERVVRAAIAIADVRGMAELSMRRVATELGVATMSLYRHVPGKADLVLAMIDTAIGDLPMPRRRPPGWRAQLELCARLEWQVFRRHPWLAPSMSLTRPDLSPKAARFSEWVLAALEETGLDLSTRMYVSVLLFSFVRGVASALEAEAEAQRDTGLSTDEWIASQAASFTAMIVELPHFQRFATEPFDFDLEKLVDFGLARLLDGVSLLIDAVPPATKDNPTP